MKKYFLLLSVFVAVVFLASCSDNTVKENESEAETVIQSLEEDTSVDIPLSLEILESSSLAGSSASGNDLEDITSVYVEPDFVVPYKLEDCYDYLKAEGTDILETKEDNSGNISEIVLKSADGEVKATSVFTYSDEPKCVVEFFEGNTSSDRFSFIYYSDGNISSISHAGSDTSVEIYLFNEDGSNKGYISSEDFANLMLGAVLEGLGGAIS